MVFKFNRDGTHLAAVDAFLNKKRVSHNKRLERLLSTYRADMIDVDGVGKGRE